MEFSQPPPDMSLPPPQQGPPPNFSMPPPMGGMGMGGPPPPRHHFGGGGGGPPPGGHGQHQFYPHHAGAGKPGHPYFKQFSNFNRGGHGGFGITQDDFDGKRLRKSVMRKTVDYNAAIVRAIENRVWQRDFRDRHALQPENIYVPELLPPPSYMDNPSNAVTTRFVKTATNKMRCPIFTLAWTPEGRRLVTGASSGEFTLWNGLTFNFETILQAHDVPVRTMVWSHNDSWMVTGDHAGYVKYWQSNMNNVKMFQAHKEPIRGISFSPTDSKFVSCSDDGTLRVWDFLRCQEERVLRGHGADVKCVHWHPQKALIVSGSKDNQQPIKLWDPKSGQALATLHAHKSTVMDLKWNNNGNWLVTASRDHLLKLFDLRNLREEVQVFRGHKKEASSVSWHPVHEGLFSSGGSDGSILFWNVGTDKEVGGIEAAHDSIVWTLAWHPLGHILCSGSNDHTIKFWTRNRPGDLMRDKYNLNTLPASLAMLDECEYDDAIIPGMGPEDKVEFTESLTADKGFIPGLDLKPGELADLRDNKKVPYSKPIPRNFQAQWNDRGRFDDDDCSVRDFKECNLETNAPGAVPLEPIDPRDMSGIVVYGKFIPVEPGSQLSSVIRQGPEALNSYISSGEIEELHDVMPFDDGNDSSSGQMSPSSKKSRFENIHHNVQIIYNNDADVRNKGQQPPSTHIPSLLGLKVPNPEDFCDSPKESPSEQEFRPNHWGPPGINNEENMRPNPWQSGPPNGFVPNNFNPNAFNPNNGNPFNGDNGPPFGVGGGDGDFRPGGRNSRFDGPPINPPFDPNLPPNGGNFGGFNNNHPPPNNSGRGRNSRFSDNNDRNDGNRNRDNSGGRRQINDRRQNNNNNRNRNNNNNRRF